MILQEAHGARVERVALDVSLDELSRLNGLTYFDVPSMHNQIRLAVDGFGQAARSMLSALLSVVQGTITIVGLTVYIISVDAGTAVGVAAAMLFGLAGATAAGKTRAEAVERATPFERLRQYYQYLATAPAPAAEVTAFEMRPELGRSMGRALKQQRNIELRFSRRAAVFEVGGFLAALLVLVAVVDRLLAQQDSSSLVTAELSALVLSILMIGAAAATLGSGLGSVLESTSLGKHLGRLEALPDAVDASGSLDVPSCGDFTIEFENVWFRYSRAQPWALKDFSATASAGAVVVIVGANGSGKSTLIKLLLRLYDPCRGTIKINGQDIRAYSLASLRQSTSALFQEYQRYDMDLRDNITLMNRTISDDIVIGACERVQMSELIDRLDLGLDTNISRMFGEAGEGRDLSGGQWQRVAAARVLVRRSRLVILDEPSASLDPEAEAALFEDLRRNLPEASIFVVSHRLSQASLADEIWVLEDGRLVEQGTHHYLLQLGGRYSAVYHLQGRAFEFSEPQEADL